jgi:hypothetical protein
MNRITNLIAVCCIAVACGDPTIVDSLTTESELTEAQCTVAGGNGCLASFEACTSDAETCRAQLRACLPPRPPPRPHGDGGECHRGGPDGGRPPGGPGGPGRGGPGRHRRPPLTQACRDALDACLQAAPADPRTCFDGAKQCMRDEFEARCAEATAQCAGSQDETCARIVERCNVGINAIPIGTVCAAE